MRISISGNDIYPDNNVYTSTASVATSTRDLSIYKWIATTSGEAGSVITYALTYANYGTASATGVILTDTLPLSETYLATTLAVTPTVNGQQIIWNLGTVPARYLPGYQKTFYVTARISNSLPTGTVLTNTASISADEAETIYGNNLSAATVVVTPYGGPDAFGYTFKDSHMVGGPNFGWIDATEGIFANVTGDDNYSNLIPIGFGFPFYGNTCTDLYFSTNGLVTFGAPSDSYNNTGLPNPNTPNNLLAAFWDDLQVYSPQAIYYKQGGTSPDRFLVVEWYNVSGLDDSSHPLTFEVVIYESGKIVFQYLDLSGTLDSNTVGIENDAGTSGLQYAYNQPRLSNNLAIEFNPPGSATPLSGVSINGPMTGTLDLAYTFTATVVPPMATLPITYTWSPAPNSGQGTTVATYAWLTTGAKLITVTAQNAVGSVAATHVITITPLIVPVQSVTISGPVLGTFSTANVFTATVAPAMATLPITYTWSPAPSSGQGTAVATYTWPTTGTKLITVTAQNTGGTAVDTHGITIIDGVLTTIDAAGATLVYTDAHGLTTILQFPNNAVTQTISLVYTGLTTVTGQSGLAFAGHAFELNAYQNGSLIPDFVFNSPVALTIHYADADVIGLDENALTVRYWTGSAWADAACNAYERHPAQNWLSVSICHLSRFAVFETGHKVFLPIVTRN